MENCTWIYLIYIILYRRSQTHKNAHCIVIPFIEKSKADLKSCDRHQNSSYFLGGLAKAPLVPIVFSSLIWVVVTVVCSLNKKSSVCVFKIYIFMPL